MRNYFTGLAVTGVLALGIFGLDRTASADDATEAEPMLVSIADIEMRIKTDDYLVPAHVCADAEAEMYEDCLPFSLINNSVVRLLPAAE